MKKVKFKYLSLFAIVGFAAALLYGVSRVLAVATSPSLGTASPFAILAFSTITDSALSISDITGDVGLSTGTGAAIQLTCAEVTGTIHDTDGAYTGGLGSAVTTCRVTDPIALGVAQGANATAYGLLNTGPNATCSAFPDTTVNGNVAGYELSGLTLGPGVYCQDVGTTGSFNLSGSAPLTLTGAGPWIFRSGSTLTASGTATVVVESGDPCNVWWRLPSEATGAILNAGSRVKGNILALHDITMGNLATLNPGRAFSQTGQVTLINNTINASTCQVVTTTTTTSTSTTTTTLQGGTTTTTLQGGTTTTTLQGGTTTTTLRPPTIPTTGEWGMMILALAFLGAIAWMVRARRSLR
jgi:hypothetical protein